MMTEHTTTGWEIESARASNLVRTLAGRWAALAALAGSRSSQARPGRLPAVAGRASHRLQSMQQACHDLIRPWRAAQVLKESI